MQRLFGSLTVRMVISHILVASLTSIIGVLLLALFFSWSLRNISAGDYVFLAMHGATQWLFGAPDGEPNPENVGWPDGFNLVVSPENTVLYSLGDTSCRAGIMLETCAPELLNLEVGERFFENNGERWIEVVVLTINGERAISRHGPPGLEPALALNDTYVYGTLPFAGIVSGAMALLSIPVALTLALLLARPQTRRLSKITNVSRRFAEGDLQERVKDRSKDDVGKLAQQFDDMADGLEQSIHALRDLAQRNAELAQQAEQAAIQAERVRLSRDLHDAIAQRLFSLSVSTATLPELIQTDQEKGIQQSRIVAGLAEQTLLDLRALLIELRPSSLIQRGLADALHTLCNEWRDTHQIPVECSLMLTGKHIPTTIEDTLYRVTQEALNNIAKHAEANSVHVALVEGQKQITLSVSDTGQGFVVPEIASNGKFGLNSMRERAHAVGGSLTIESDAGRGTTVHMVLPLERMLTI